MAEPSEFYADRHAEGRMALPCRSAKAPQPARVATATTARNEAMTSEAARTQPSDWRIVAGAVQAGVSRGHINREARALAACDGKLWPWLLSGERLAYEAEAAGLAVGVHVA